MDKELPNRKRNRLEHYDYSSSGAYFITICTSERRNYFWNGVGATTGRPQILDKPNSFVGATIGRPQALDNPNSFVGATTGRPQTLDKPNSFVGATIGRPQDVDLSQYGKIAEEAIGNIPSIYPALKVDHYVIMPDHIHLLLIIRADEYGRPMVAPTMSRVVQQLKGYITKRIGCSIWQKLFFDHVIRDRQDYEEHVKYICENPAKWIIQHQNAEKQE